MSATLKVQSSRWWNPSCRTPLLIFALCTLNLAPRAAHAAAITGASLSANPVTFETGGIPNGTTVSYTVDTAGSVELDVFNATTNTQVAAVTQTATVGSNSIFWNALWLIGGQYGRSDGTYSLVLNLTTTGGNASLTIPTLVQLNSVDIHNLTATPSYDANSQPTFPYIIQYNLAKSAYVTATIANSSGTIVRTLLSNKLQVDETISTNTLVWNGMNDAGQGVPLGIYTSTITATDAAISGSKAIPRAVNLTVASFAGGAIDPQKAFEQNAFVYPNPVRSGQATFQYQAIRDGATITLKIYTINGTLVRSETFSGLVTGNTYSFSWDAANQSGRALGRGLYFYVLKETDSSGTLQTVKKLAVIR